MKKLMAVLLVLSLLVSSAAVFAQAETTADAEAIELNWADFEELLKDESWAGDFFSFDEVAIKFYVPEMFLPVELDDEMREEGYIAYFMPKDESAAIGVQYVDAEMKDADAYIEALKDLGVTDAEKLTVNGLPAVSYTNPDDKDVMVLALVTEKGYVLEFAFSPVSDEGFLAVSTVMIASIQESED